MNKIPSLWEGTSATWGTFEPENQAFAWNKRTQDSIKLGQHFDDGGSKRTEQADQINVEQVKGHQLTSKTEAKKEHPSPSSERGAG